jgi:WD40 repeat protein
MTAANNDSVLALRFDPAGQWLVAGRQSGRLSFHAVNPGANPPPDANPSGASITSLSFSQDGAWLAAGAKDGTATIQSLAGRPPIVLRSREPSVDFVQFRGSGSELITASLLGRIHVWTMPAAAESPHRVKVEGLTGIALSGDAHVLATSDRNRRIVIRDAASFEPRLTISRQGDPISKLALNQKGDRLAAATMDGNVRIFELDRARLQALGEQRVRQAKGSELTECSEFLPARPAEK